MATTKINNNYTTTTNYMLQGIADLGETTQQTQNTPAPVAQPQQEAPKTPKTPKTNKITTPIINTTYKSFTTQHGHYVPSQNKKGGPKWTTQQSKQTPQHSTPQQHARPALPAASRQRLLRQSKSSPPASSSPMRSPLGCPIRQSLLWQ